MKTTIQFFALMLLSSYSLASQVEGKTFLCHEQNSLKSSGKIQIVKDLGQNGLVMSYSSSSESSEGWTLRLLNGGLYNADRMVRGGQSFGVGRAKPIPNGYYMELQGSEFKKMYCLVTNS